MEKSTADARRWCVAILALAAAVYGFMWVMAPPIGDDLWYRFWFLDEYARTGSVTESWWRNWVFRWSEDNIRLGTVITILSAATGSTLVPALISTAAWGAMLWWAGRWARVLRPWRPSWFSLLLLGFILLLPWTNYMVCTPYPLNYIMPTALGLWGLWLWTFRRHMVAGGALLFLAGWGHEAMAATLLAGMVGYAVVGRRRLAAAQWVLVGVVAVALALHFLAPAFQARPHHYYQPGHGPLQSIGWVLSRRENWISWAYVFAGLVYIALNGRDKAVVGMLGGMVVGGMISGIAAVDAQRPEWAGYTAAIIGFVRLGTQLRPRLPRWVLWAVLAFLAVHWASVIFETFRLRAYELPARERFMAADSDWVYAPVLSRGQLLETSLGLPTAVYLDQGCERKWLYNIRIKSEPEDNYVLYVPEEFADMTAPGTKVPGANPYYLKGHHIYCQADTLEPYTPYNIVPLTVDRGLMRRTEVWRRFRFMGRDGRVYEWITTTNLRLNCLPVCGIDTLPAIEPALNP